MNLDEGNVKRVKMDKYKSTEAPWNPQTPVKPIAPICRKTAEEQSNENQAVEGNRLAGKTMAGLEHLSCLDLMALANSASVHFSGQIPWANNGIEVPSRNVVCGGPEMEIEMSKTKTNREMMQKANEAVESLSSASNIVAEQIKTPEKPKRKKHRPKVVKDADPKPQTPRKPTPRRKYARKKDEESTPSTHAKKLCRRALDFEDESFKPNAVETESASRQKQLEESKDWLTSAPGTPNRKRNQSNRKRKEPKNNVGVMSQAAKRRQGKQPTCNIHPSEIQYNEHCLYFTNLQQQGMRCNAQEDSKCYTFTFTSQPSTTMEEKQSNVPLDRTETPIKKKTTGHARFRNLSSINKDEMPQNSNSNNNKLLVDTLRKKKQKTLVPASFTDELWKQLYSVEAISEKLRLLDINRENSETALLPYSQGNEIILFRGGAGAIVPVKKRHARPRVDLDNETERVWKLLLENIDSSGIDGSDEEKEKWWKEERSVLEGRAHSFIARMHLVLGDRRFTAWKGSVVDSVVGVFLTQNVSDHLSSSAFMSLAAAFPAPSVPSTSFDVGTSSMPPIQIAYLDSEESTEKNYVNSEETCSEIASSAAHEPVGKITIPKAQLDSDGKGSSVEVDDETYLVQNTERAGSSSVGEHHASFVKLLQGLESQGRGVITVSVEESNQYENSRQEILVSSNPGILQESPKASPGPGDSSSQVKSLKGQTRSSDDSNEPCCCSSSKPWTIPDINESTSCLHLQQGTQTPSAPDELNLVDDATFNAKGKKEKQEGFDWDSLRKEAEGRKGKRERTTRTMDSVDWEAIRTSDVSEVAATIKSRGMNNKLAERIQGFLDRLVIEHGSIDLEWLRDVPPDRAKEYLLSFRGLGLKSVECVRLLTLHHLAFPVDTNVGRIAVRLGWVPLQPLPESLQLHLLEMYPVLESIQKYLWPRLCKLDQKTLYELHYQMITFGKVFCTKSKPNCNACPMRGECRHFASAFASARLALPDIEKGIGTPDKNPYPLHLPEPLQRDQGSEVVKHSELANSVTCCEPIVEVPASPELECAQVSIADIEDAFFEDPEEIPTIKLDMVALTSNLKKIMELRDENMSTALVALTAEAASIPMPKLKNISQLRTEHQVYELPDSHPLLFTLEKREPDDPCSYLLAIWTPGETTDSVQPTVRKCVSQEVGKLCDEETCFSCNNIKETRSQIVRGTILIPCRTAMKGSFPLNGTYFQVNEVFADHDSSLRPIDVPREWLWNLARKTVYFGTSIPSIFKGLPMETIQQCFWRGYVCVRGFDRKTRGPKPLIARLHFPASKMGKSQGKSSNPRGA